MNKQVIKFSRYLLSASTGAFVFKAGVEFLSLRSTAPDIDRTGIMYQGIFFVILALITATGSFIVTKKYMDK